MTLARFSHHEPLTFPGWLDLTTGQTLSAVPGETYDISPASGNPADEIPAAWFEPLDPPAPVADEESGGDEGESAPEAVTEPETPGPEPEAEPELPAEETVPEPPADGEEPQQF